MTTTQTETTGLKNADELIVLAEKAGLKVAVKKTDVQGDELLPGHTSVTVTIEMRCPAAHAETMLGVDIRAESLIAFFYKSHRKGARAKFTFAERRGLYGSRKIKTLRRLGWAAEHMGADMARHFERAGESIPQSRDLDEHDQDERTTAPVAAGEPKDEQAEKAPASSSKVILRRAADGYGYVSRDGRWTVRPAYSPTTIGGSASRPSYWIIEDTKGEEEQTTRTLLVDARELVGHRMKRDAEQAPTKVVLVPNGYGAGYKSTDGVWDIVPTFGRRRRGVAPSRPAFFTIRHVPSDTELEGTHRTITAVRAAFAAGEIKVAGGAR
ncbi:hypothetical protein [Streptomyces nanshensis]|uniref:Uncharacterized protein n=1 Tax=Streptomyces nanshensis TaxID=518642 RepID=A0A1E7LAH4_9ACTN|nr:hypothetical protein [Streptomyces nanshensis]OEV13207.1 hypothetical protein AN218_04635 [Streptomyces nanshensis]